MERVNQILGDRLQMYVMNSLRSWEDYFTLVDFIYNSGYHIILRRIYMDENVIH